jgi:serine/threonine protein kinase
VLAEAALLERIEHPNVMRLHAVDASEDGTWLVCEWIDGKTLADLRGKMGPVSAACCAVQIFAALAAMRRAGVVHRDIKPGNLMLTAGGDVKLIDFGVAFHAGLGRGDTVAGSPRYMDPRILGGGGADGRSDMYGAGLVLAELLLGEPLWPEMAPLQLHQFLRREGLARLRRVLAFAHPEMRAVIEAAVAPCIAPEWASAADPEAAGARIGALLAAWGVRDVSGYLAGADGWRDERMLRVLRSEAQAKLDDGALKAKDRAPWFGYAASLGVGAKDEQPRRMWRWALVPAAVVAGRAAKRKN